MSELEDLQFGFCCVAREADDIPTLGRLMRGRVDREFAGMEDYERTGDTAVTVVEDKLTKQTQVCGYVPCRKVKP